MKVLAAGITWLRRIADIALIVLIAAVLLAVVIGKVVPLTGRQSIVIGGRSMEPAIGLGAAVVESPVDPAALAVGNVVSLQVGEDRAVYTHRIVAVVDRADGRWIRTKGDANVDPDPTLVPVSDVIGRVDLAVPWIGYLMTLLTLPTGVMFVIGLAATLLAIAWLLESLEPARVVRVAVPPAPGRAGRLTPSRPGADLAPGSPAPSVASQTVGPRPIATGALVARSISNVLAGPPALLVPADGPGVLARVAAASRTALPATDPGWAAPIEPPAQSTDASALPRPTAREQLDRSQRIRAQRARWQLGRARDGDPR